VNETYETLNIGSPSQTSVLTVKLGTYSVGDRIYAQ